MDEAVESFESLSLPLQLEEHVEQEDELEFVARCLRLSSGLRFFSFLDLSFCCVWLALLRTVIGYCCMRRRKLVRTVVIEMNKMKSSQNFKRQVIPIIESKMASLKPNYISHNRRSRTDIILRNF